jgi:hypothetical protein
MTILSSSTSYEHIDCAINNESNTLEMQHENMSIDEDESTVKVSVKKPHKKGRKNKLNISLKLQLGVDELLGQGTYIHNNIYNVNYSMNEGV